MQNDAWAGGNTPSRPLFTRAPLTCALLVLATLSACTGDQGHLTDITQPKLTALAVADSVPRRLTAQAAATAGVPIRKGESAVVTVQSTSCAAPGDALSVSGAFSATLGTDVCHVTPAAMTFGPATQDGQMVFSVSGPYGTGGSQVSGTYPDFTVSLGDGYGDLDYNDVVLTVHILPCPLFNGTTGDSLLDDAAIQRILDQIWADSHANLPDPQRVEVGGMIVRNPGGSIGFQPFTNSGTQACTIPNIGPDLTAALQANTPVIGIIHTHPEAPGLHTNTGQCTRAGPNGTLYSMHPGVSPADGNALAAAGSYFGSGVRQFVMDADSVYQQTAGSGNNVVTDPAVARSGKCR